MGLIFFNVFFYFFKNNLCTAFSLGPNTGWLISFSWALSCQSLLSPVCFIHVECWLSFLQECCEPCLHGKLNPFPKFLVNVSRDT